MQLMASVKNVVAPSSTSTSSSSTNSTSALFSSVSLRARRHSVKADDGGSKSGTSFRRSSSSASKDGHRSVAMAPPPASVAAAPSRPIAVAPAVLDTVSKRSPLRVAVRYGDTIRLFARSKYVPATAAGGYVGTFAGSKRFRTSKSGQKQDELVCLPPVVPGGVKRFRSSTFVVLSYSGLGAGTPVSYGDVVLLVDEDGRVWNNKMGVGPSLKNGCFGPKAANTPGEMHLSFYQLQAAEGEDNDDDED